MDLYDGMTKAIGQYVADVKSSDFQIPANNKIRLLDYWIVRLEKSRNASI
jgi:hypothetical protein